MTVNFNVQQKTLVVTVKGDIDQHTAASLREQIDLRLTHEMFEGWYLILPISILWTVPALV